MTTQPVTPKKGFSVGSLLQFLPLVGLIAPIMQGIEKVHGDAVAGATKKQLAMESLGLATAAAEAALPGTLKVEADAASEAASKMIDVFAELFNKTGWGTTPAIVTQAVADHDPATPTK